MLEAGVENPDYAAMSDEDADVARDQLVNEKGFFILPSQLFENVEKKQVKHSTIFHNNQRIEITSLWDFLIIY